MSKNPSLTPKLPTLDDFGMPSSADLQQVGVVSHAISKIIAVDEAVIKFHHKMLRHGIACRVELALATARDKKAFANFAKDARIKALPTRPKGPSDTLQCLFQATYPDPKKASKYFKRIEPLWLKRCSAAEVLAFLEKHGVSKPSPKATSAAPKPRPGKTASGPAKANKTAKAPFGGNGDQVSAAAINEDDPPGGSFHLWPGEIAVDRFYDLRVKVVDHDGEMSVFELFDVSPAVVQ